jgi:hypothetical protein
MLLLLPDCLAIGNRRAPHCSAAFPTMRAFPLTITPAIFAEPPPTPSRTSEQTLQAIQRCCNVLFGLEFYFTIDPPFFYRLNPCAPLQLAAIVHRTQVMPPAEALRGPVSPG